MRRSVAVLLAFAAATGAADEDWQRVAERDGIVIERRGVEGSAVHELRATAHSPVPPAAIMATLWRHEEYVQFVPYLKRLDVLREETDTKLFYEQIHVPVARDRDATLRATRSFSAATGIYELSTRAVPDGGPPATSAYVRVRNSASLWRLVPAVDGGTEVTYTIRIDVGGLLPAWVVNAIQKDTTAKLVRAMLDRARQTTR